MYLRKVPAIPVRNLSSFPSEVTTLLTNTVKGAMTYFAPVSEDVQLQVLLPNTNKFVKVEGSDKMVKLVVDKFVINVGKDIFWIKVESLDGRSTMEYKAQNPKVQPDPEEVLDAQLMEASGEFGMVEDDTPTSPQTVARTAGKRVKARYECCVSGCRKAASGPGQPCKDHSLVPA